MNLHKRQHGIVKYALILLGLLALGGVEAKEKITFYEYDALGNIVAATDEQGEILWKEHYDPYGNRLVRDQASGDNRIWYTGHQENDFGLIYMGARHYDPTTGRFLQIDPMGFQPNNPQSFNRYAYANNNPYRYMDPNGESIVEIFTEVLPAAGRSFGALAAYGVGAATGNQALMNEAAEGARDMQVDNALALASVVGPPGSGVALKTNRASTVMRRARKSGCCCFEPGTPVLTAEGSRPIEAIDIGELVWAADTETGEVGLKPVTELFLTKGKPLYELTLATHDNERETLRVTGNHPYRVIGIGWVDSGKLRPGMKVEGYEGQVLTVAEIRETDRVEDTYNLEVADYHTFYAGDKLALVHNCTVCGGGRKTIVEDDVALEKSEKLRPGQQSDYETVKDMLSQGKPGRNQHELKGDLKGKKAADLRGSGKGRGRDRVIYTETKDEIIVHDIVDYH